MKTLKISMLIISFLSTTYLFGQIPIFELCDSRNYIDKYEPKKFDNLMNLNKEIIDSIEKLFLQRFGDRLYKKIYFTSGYNYDIEYLNTSHKEVIKGYQWTIPKYILNYSFYDLDSEIYDCIDITISEKGIIISAFVPKIAPKFRNLNFITKQEAITRIKEKTKRKRIKKINFEYSTINYNAEREIYEWEFGVICKVWIECIPNGKIKFGRFRGLIYF